MTDKPIIIKPGHDKLFRKALENPIVAKEFFDAHLPEEVKAIIGTSALTLEKDSFIDENLKNSISDVLFSVKSEDEDVYIYLLLEHQSRPHRFMAFRLFKYMLNICDRYLTLNPKSKKLPLIYPMVFYNGKQKYNVSKNLWDLFDKASLAKSFWAEDYLVVNVHKIPDEELKKRAWSGIMEFFMKHIHERDLLQRWREIKALLPELVKMEMGHNYIQLMLCYTLTSIQKDDKMELKKLIVDVLNEDEGEEIVTSLAEHWAQKGWEQGVAQGVAQGVERGVKTTAFNMIKSGFDPTLISQITGLSITDVLLLNKNKQK